MELVRRGLAAGRARRGLEARLSSMLCSVWCFGCGCHFGQVGSFRVRVTKLATRRVCRLWSAYRPPRPPACVALCDVCRKIGLCGRAGPRSPTGGIFLTRTADPIFEPRFPISIFRPGPTAAGPGPRGSRHCSGPCTDSIRIDSLCPSGQTNAAVGRLKRQSLLGSSVTVSSPPPLAAIGLAGLLACCFGRHWAPGRRGFSGDYTTSHHHHRFAYVSL